MIESAPLAVIRSYDDLIAACRARMRELDVAYETVDDLAGVPTRYVAKLLSHKRIKIFGPISFDAVCGALGVKFVMVEDKEAAQKLKSRLQKRRYRHNMLTIGSIPWLITPLTAERLSKLRLEKLSAKRRRQIARKAAIVRWEKVKAAVASRSADSNG